MSSQQQSSAASPQKRSAASASGGSSSNKRPQTNSNAPSRSAANFEGFSFLEQNYRSLLYHPAGLPLAAVLFEQELPNVPSSYPVEAFPPEIWTLDTGKDILSDVCSESDFYDMKEKDITKRLQEKINETFGDFYIRSEASVAKDGQKNEGFLDLVFLPKSENEDGTTSRSTSQTKSTSTPLCVVEVGRVSANWWQKFHQGTKYIEIMKGKSKGQFCFQEPVLLVIITLQKKTSDSQPDFDFCMGVFLCIPRKEDEKFRVSLIWHKQYDDVVAASKSFGLLLRVMPHFQARRSIVYNPEEGSEYFSSNCIKADDRILRSFDTRLRPSDRRPDLYLDTNCRDIVGGEVLTVLKIPARAPAAPEDLEKNASAPTDSSVSQDGDPHGRDNFFKESPFKRLSIISAPFREGVHVAQHPIDFVPIIEHLESIHKAGYVHGDIRACNTAFPKIEGGPGYLIDFDFSGKAGEVYYPTGYVSNLHDGDRFGNQWQLIEKWHDWYALGMLIFFVHGIPKPEAEEELQMWPIDTDCKDYWTTLKRDPPPEKIAELKKLLSDAQAKGWKVEASKKFEIWLENHTAGIDTKQFGTGSPPKRAHK